MVESRRGWMRVARGGPVWPDARRAGGVVAWAVRRMLLAVVGASRALGLAGRMLLAVVALAKPVALVVLPEAQPGWAVAPVRRAQRVRPVQLGTPVQLAMQEPLQLVAAERVAVEAAARAARAVSAARRVQRARVARVAQRQPRPSREMSRPIRLRRVRGLSV
jgi:hypothetical protein